MLDRRRYGPLRDRLEEVFLHQEVDRRRLIRRCAVAALLLVVAVYADVIFRGASVSAANYLNVTVEPFRDRVQLYPERSGREAYHAYYDIGGAAFQSEPGAQFMRRSFWNGESVFWNPYSAAGSYGIETLVDVKTSPLSMTVALLGGSDAVFHLAFLGFSFVGVFCLLVLLTVQWRLSLLAAIAGGVTYLLNGYNVANLASNVSQTWLYFPVLALALVSFAKNPRVLSFLGIAAGSALILATTFLPTTIVILGTILFVGAASAVAAAYAQSAHWRPALVQGGKLVAAQGMAVALALLILAVIYLPILEALRYMATGEYYSARSFVPANLFNLVSLFTPKHAFEAYNAITAKADALRGNIAFHQGIIGALLVTQVVRAWPPFQRIVVCAMAAALLLLLARVYGLPLYSEALDWLPLIGNLGQQYLWIAIAALFTLLVPFGLHGLIQSGVRPLPLALGALVILASLVYTSYRLGIENFIGWFYVSVAVCLVVFTAAIVARLRSAALVVPALALVALSFVEMTFYVNSFRFARTDRFLEPPRLVRFLQLNTGLHRVASYGHWGIPPEYGSAYGIAQVGSMNFHLFPRYFELFDRLILPDPADRWRGFITLVRARDADLVNLAALNMVGTKYLIVPGTYKRLQAFMGQTSWVRVYEDPYFLIFENPSPLPRSYVTHGLVAGKATPIDRGQSPHAVTVSDDPQLIETARKLGITGEAAEAAAATEFAAITRYEHVRVEIVANLSRPGILVLNDTWHANWRARVNGQPQHIGVVNEAFRGLALPAGRHVIEMSYAPRTLLAAKILTALGLLIAFLLFAARQRIDPWLRKVLDPVPAGTSSAKV
jgi:hypothetical protein